MISGRENRSCRLKPSVISTLSYSKRRSNSMLLVSKNPCSVRLQLVVMLRIIVVGFKKKKNNCCRLCPGVLPMVAVQRKLGRVVLRNRLL